MTTSTAIRERLDGLAIVGLFVAGVCNIAYFLVFSLA
jgi:hypothetical protein